MKASRSTGTQEGFTLLEVIVTLVVAAILGTILVSFMGQGLTGSVQPLIRVQNANTLGQVLENITADYAKLNSACPKPTRHSTVFRSAFCSRRYCISIRTIDP